MACATVCHSKAEAGFVSGTLSSKLFGMARNAEYKIAGFPDFSGALTDLKQFQRSPQPTYEVTVPCGNGVLVVKESLIQFWTVKHPDFSDAMTALLEQHNKEFNPDCIKRGAESEEVPEGEEDSSPTKRLRLSAASTLADLENKCPDRTRVQKTT